MSYVVLARKWRPMSFRDLVGQEHVSRTLGNAIDQGRVAHAFLFTGVRGVGKTTSARILAKALNCLEPIRPEDGSIEPCLSCSACREIANGTDVDVREIDGASYTGVDEIRKLQESLPYPPTRDRFKIFIVDEVHMLSNNAWNALLKTLEEPPPHVKFIFATTEVHKVPVTILSRVQRFDFKMIPTRLIADRVRHVLDKEGIETDDRAVTLVARQAAGSMRDALSLLDQAIAFNAERLEGEEVSRVLGVAGYPRLHAIAGAVLEGDAEKALEGVREIAEQSCDLAVVSRDLLSVFRDLVVARLCTGDELLDLSDDERGSVRQLASGRDEHDLVRLQRGFAQGFDDVVRSADPRGALEMLLVRLSLRPALVPLDSLMTRLSDLEARLSGSSGGAPGGAGSPPGRKRPPNRAPADPASRNGGASAAPPAEPTPRASEPAIAARARKSPPTDVDDSAAVPRASGDAPERPPVARTLDDPDPAAPTANGIEPPTRPIEPSARRPDVVRGWGEVLSELEASRPDLAAFLKHAVPLEVGPDALVLGYEQGNVLEVTVKSPECVSALEEAARARFGRAPRVEFRSVVGKQETLAVVEKKQREGRRRDAMERAQKHPSVIEAVEILGARVKRVELRDS